MNRAHVTELLADLITNSLDSSDASRVRRHLSHCVACRSEWERLQAAFDSLGMLAPAQTPSETLRNRILAGLPRRITALPSFARGVARHPLAAIAASLLLLAGLGVSITMNVHHYTAIRNGANFAQLAESSRILTVLHGTELAPAAHGMIVISENHSRGLLLAFGLPEPPEGYAYQLWLVRNDDLRNAGIVRVNAQGHVVHHIEISEPLNAFLNFRITIEPATGSDVPTGTRVMDGSLETVNM